MIVDSVIITGAGSGIGRAIALHLGGKGIDVLCISRTENCKFTAEQIVEAGGIADSISMDLADYENVTTTISRWKENRRISRCGLILAAAILGPTQSTTDRVYLWDKVFRTNIFGNLAVLYTVMPDMIAQRFGRIIFFSGGGAAYGFPAFPAYSASKTAIVRIVENLHDELSEEGDFSVIALAPGAIQTKMLQEVKMRGGEVRTEGSMDEPVQFVEEFLTEDSKFLSGRLVHVRDDWSSLREICNQETAHRQWKLRRVE